jgi:hypothetical protein
MIISPPFLPARTTGQADEAWITAAMPPAIRLTSTGAPEGSFPLSHNLSWHNGMHIAAPANQTVRAIADGKVIFAGKPNPVKAELTDAQNYNPFDPDPSKPTAAWTDNGCIILEHKTEIGAEGDTATELTYYSLYMHLSDIARITPAGQTAKRQLQAGDNVWRKDEIGSTGQVYGNAGQIHFEICLNTANLQTLIGRAPAWTTPISATAPITTPTADGRTDSVFGSMYFYLPASTPTAASAAMPTTHLRGSTAPATTLGSPMWVKMDYSAGHCTFTSYDANGILIQALSPETNAEYNLYTDALARHNALSATEKTTSSPSGWYELLRFGRNIGRGTAATDKDLLPATAAHWRKIANPAGTAVWADLNAAGSFKFSDADFLALSGWNCISDDTNPADQRCDSNHLKTLICDPDDKNTQRMEVAELAKRLKVAEVKTKLKRTICQFPTEWDQATVSARYNFVQELDNFKAAKASGNDMWPKLEAHLKAISFANLPSDYKAADWHFDPKEFIRVMRLCGWLSRAEMVQLLPMNSLRKAKIWMWESVSLTGAASVLDETDVSAVGRRIELNKSLRKFLADTPIRLACFFGNATQETQWFSKFSENSPYWYKPWDGRGFLQLTHASNYIKYWDFRNITVSQAARSSLATHTNTAQTNRKGTMTDPTNSLSDSATGISSGLIALRNSVGTDNVHIANTAGTYWAWSMASKAADEYLTDSTNTIKTVTTNLGVKHYYENIPFGKVAATVNVGRPSSNFASIWGVQARFMAFANAQVILLDTPVFPQSNASNLTTPQDFVVRRP